MSVTVQSLESPCVTWKTILPHVGRSVRSPTFTLDKVEASLSMECTWKDVESWEVLFKPKTNVTPPGTEMCVVSYVEKKDNFQYLGYEIVASSSFGYGYISKFNRCNMPDDEVSLVFVFHFPSISKDARFTTNPKQTELEKLQNNYSCLTSLSQDIEKLFGKEEHSDVVLKCGDRSFLANKKILSIRSEVFAAMFKNEMSENRTGTVDIVDMEPTVLEQFLQYIYCGRLEEPCMDSVSDLYRAGDKYGIPSLKCRCASFMEDNLTEDNVCEILLLADTFGDTGLSEKAMCFVLDRAPFLGSEKWHLFAESHPAIAVKVFLRFHKK